MSRTRTIDCLKTVNIKDICGVVYLSQMSYDYYTDDLMYLSIVGYKTAMDSIYNIMMKESENVLIQISGGSAYKRRSCSYTMEQIKAPNSDIVHATIYIKDKYTINKEDEEFTLYMYVKESDQNKDKRLKELLYDKLNKYCSVPILPEWIDYIYDYYQENGYLRSAETTILEGVEEIKIYRLYSNKNSVKQIIATGLQEGDLNINGSNAPSVLLNEDTGLNDYLSTFGSLLANKIQEKFEPKFIPGAHKYSNYLNTLDDYIHCKGVELYAAQLSVIQANSNNFNKNKFGFIVGEMGSGKTLMAASTCYVHHANKNKGFNTVIMCPSHLVEKWKSEVETYIPNAKGYIVHDLDELLAIESKLRNRYRTENMFVIMSKEIAKLGYDLRPSAIWSESKQCFICPDCGQPLFKVENQTINGRKQKVKIKLTELDFLKQYAYNEKCSNVIKVWDKKNKKYIERTCGCKLWTALNRDDIDHDWIKLGKQGWIKSSQIPRMTEMFMEKENINKKETDLFNELFEQYNLYQEGKSYKVSYKGSKKFPVAKYIYKRMKNVFDYTIMDEAHLLSKNSQQGLSSYYLMKSASHVLNLTGTLLNGYASDLFYTLYRVCPGIMKQEGFNYNDKAEFTRIFGVTSRESTFNNVRRSVVGTTKEKQLPGVSPLVFTKFLLNMASFITLDDMAEGLPSYQEIPIGVQMDTQTATNYIDIENFFKERCSSFESGSRKIMGSVFKLLSQYSDAPHCKRTIVNPDTLEVQFESTVLEKTIRNKEEKLLEIIQEKIEAGEKVLVYYNNVNTTDLGEHLCSYLYSNNINAFELKASVKAEKRMEYINKEVAKGAQVMITNPSLVETGLDLLDFTTIIFFQIGYSLSTMRQASRRSWRLSQTKPIEVYFLYYIGTIQEQAISLMATKLQAAQTLEGNFSEEGLKAMSENNDMLTQIANNVVNDIKTVVNLEAFQSAKEVKQQSNKTRKHDKTIDQIEYVLDYRGQKNILIKSIKIENNKDNKTYIKNEYINNLLKLFI